jgi:hypothetical protein
LETRNYLLLLSLTKTTAVFGVGVLERLRAEVDAKCNPLWVDAGGVGVFVSTSLSAQQVWQCALPEHLRDAQQAAVKDMLILELGDDHHGLAQSKAVEWLRRRRIALAA